MHASEPFSSFLIRVLGPDGVTVGAGIILSSDLAVTCAHVVVTASSAVGQTIKVEFLVNGEQRDVAVLTEGWSPPEQDDLAFLRMDDLPSGVRPAVLGAAAGRLGRDFAAFGFPISLASLGHTALGKLGAPVTFGAQRRPVWEFQGNEIERGMSGGPVLDYRAGQVVGMICEFWDIPRIRCAYAVTAETIRHYSPQALFLQPLPEEVVMDIDWFQHIVSLLRESRLAIQIIGDESPSVLLRGSQLSFSLPRHIAEDLLPNARRRGHDREEVYLTRFILSQQYNRWERAYLPLAGRLSEPTPLTNLRLRDPSDPRLSPAGEPLDDLRDALYKHHKTRLVITGEPGCGKTTTLDRLALDLALQRLRHPSEAKLPLRVDLEDFDDTPPHPDDFLRRKWLETGLDLTYDQAVLNGEVCFLLDGLNQMPLSDRPDRIDRWNTWAIGLPFGNWAIFTCRSLDYQPRLNLPEAQVQSLDADRIRQYLKMRLGDDQLRLKRLVDEFEHRLRAGDHRFNDLARNIFWLSLLVERGAQDQKLTSNRAILMEHLVRLRIDREFQRARQPEHLRRDAQATFKAEERFLRRLAHHMQASGGTTPLPKSQACRFISLEGIHPRLDHEQALKLGLDCGLLEEKTAKGEPVYTFYHHLLQEYFAGLELLERFRAGENLEALWRVGWKAQDELPNPPPEDQFLPPPPVTGWEETTRMAAGLAGDDLPRLAETVARCNLPLAGRCLAEAGASDELAEPLRYALLARQRSRRAHLRARIDAGLALGELGHPELRPQPFSFENKTIYAILPPMQPVRAGAFIYGSSPEDVEAERAWENELAEPRRVELPAFSIGRYPVTNSEYRFFFEAGGYDQERWWDEPGWEWRRGGPHAHEAAIQDLLSVRSRLQQMDLEQIARYFGWPRQRLAFWKEMAALSEADARLRAQRLFSRPFDRPAFWDDPKLSAPARPVVGVNWYEARAYCRWLSAVSRRDFDLPSELQWEKAARGREGRDYPWKGGFDVRRCNTIESRIGAPTPVGLYAEGRSPFGLYDAAGNVWEWCADWYQCYPGGNPQASDFDEKYRVVRGGSWGYLRRGARCAVRTRGTPVNFSDDLGFRVSSPGSISVF